MTRHKLHCTICGRWFSGVFAARALRKHRQYCTQNGTR